MTQTSSQFDALISAAWSERLDCEATTQAGAQCRRLARWRLNLHGCEQVLLCGHHLHAWQRTARWTMAPICGTCGQTFAKLSDGYTVVPL